MKKFAKVSVCAACVCVAMTASAAWVSEQDARKAAEAFVKNDAVGRTVLSGCDVVSISQRGNIWVVSLAPSGQVLLGRSDLADPIVGFSKNDFTEPDPDSPAYAYLAGIDASLATLESNGGTRHDRWNRLLAGGTGLRLKAGDIEDPGTVVIPPFLKTHWNQWQPYNDYAPLYDVSASESGYWPYRGRCACGCVATAASQILYYFKWPARIDNTISCNHLFTSYHVDAYFPIRFDGHNPIDWQGIVTDYVYYNGGYDLRGKVAESVRQPIARLVLWADELAQMDFGDKTEGGSGANYGTVSGNLSDWYTPARKISVSSTTDMSEVLSHLQAGIPLSVTIPGHAVVAHGWASDSGSTYLYLNYGWGGDNDGYYNIPSQANSSSVIQEIYVGHYPRAKPQIDPLPKVCGTSLTLNWHFPDFYTNQLSGFTVTASKTVTEATTFAENFSDPNGVPSGDTGIFAVGTDSQGYDGNLLSCFSSYKVNGYATLNSAYYTFPTIYTLTSASVLTFHIRSQYALSNVFEVQARFNGGEWTTIMSPLLSETGDSGWGMERLYLGNHGGETMQIRFYKAYSGGSCYAARNCVFVDDLCVTEVLAPQSPANYSVGKADRSLPLSGLTSGATYSFIVTPIVSGALVEGEASAPITVTIAGERRTPIPGEQTYTSSTLTFSASDTSGTWSYSGTAVDDTSVGDGRNCTITCTVSGELTSTSTLSFDWTANDYYGVYNGADCYDVLSATFKASDGTESSVWCITNTSAKTSRQQVACNLATMNGQSGKIVMSYSHVNGGYGRGGVIYAPRITNVRVPSVPAVAWNTETLTALGTPQIVSVSSVSEGFYRECGLGTTTFNVTCSESVTSLEALPSHLSLVRDEDVTVTPKGNGRFSVTVRPSGVTEDNARSRMILTLAATDSNGTTAYRDLSLRFAPMDAVVNAVTVDATTSGGDSFSVEIPYEWIETSGLVPSGSAASAYEAALSATADADGDGLPNWAEYVCGTSPTNSASKLTATIRIENGTPIVGYEPSGQLADGFKAIIKGTNNLSEDFSDWQVTTGTTSLRFFRVEIVPE